MKCRHCRKFAVSSPMRVLEWLKKALDTNPPAHVVAVLVDVACAELLEFCSLKCAVQAKAPLGPNVWAKRKAA